MKHTILVCLTCLIVSLFLPIGQTVASANGATTARAMIVVVAKDGSVEPYNGPAWVCIPGAPNTRYLGRLVNPQNDAAITAEDRNRCWEYQVVDGLVGPIFREEVQVRVFGHVWVWVPKHWVADQNVWFQGGWVETYQPASGWEVVNPEEFRKGNFPEVAPTELVTFKPSSRDGFLGFVFDGKFNQCVQDNQYVRDPAKPGNGIWIDTVYDTCG